MEVAVIKTGGKQYVVSKGDTISIEKLSAIAAKGGTPDANASRETVKKGDSVTFDKVLLVDNGMDTTIGAPLISGAHVTGTVTMVGRAKKVEVVKYKPKSRYFKRNGHRQPLVKVQIESIS